MKLLLLLNSLKQKIYYKIKTKVSILVWIQFFKKINDFKFIT